MNSKSQRQGSSIGDPALTNNINLDSMRQNTIAASSTPQKKDAKATEHSSDKSFEECDLSQEDMKQEEDCRDEQLLAINRDSGAKSTFHDRNQSMAPMPHKTQTLVFQKTTDDHNNLRSHSPTEYLVENASSSAQQVFVDKQQMKNFNPGAFRFKKSFDGLNIEQEQFKKAFYLNKHVNRDKINQQLVELTYQQVMRRLKKEKKDDKTFPAEFYQNEMKWAAMLMRSKNLQKIMANYTDQIAKVLESELGDQESKTLVHDYINYPHAHHSQSVSPPPRNTIQLENLKHPVWMPEKAPKLASSSKKDDGGVRSVYSQHRKHLNELALKNRKKKEVLQELTAIAKEKNVAQEKITEQVLNKMAVDRIQRRKAMKRDKPGMTPFQEAIHEGLQSAKSRIDSIETLDEQFKEQLLDIEEHLIESSKQKGGRNPGGEIKHMLTKWSNQQVYSDDDMTKYAGELWMSLQEFEKDMRETEFTLELENKHLKNQYRTRVDGIRAQTSMRIEALESALIEVKLKLAREREQAQMQLAEMESRIYNNHMDANDAMSDRIRHVEQTLDDPKFQDISEEKKISLLQRMLRRLQLVIRSMQNEKNQFKKEINDLNFTIETNKEFNEKIQNTSNEAKEQVLYYQLTLYEMLEQTGILNKLGDDCPVSEEKRLALEEIIQLNEERIRKDQEQDLTFREPNDKLKIGRLINFVDNFHEVLLEVDFRQIFSHYQTVVEVKARSVEQVQKELVKLGMLSDVQNEDYQKVAGKKSQNDPGSVPSDAMSVQALSGKLSDAVDMDQFEQKVIHVDANKLKSIQKQFEMLSKPMTDGMTDLIIQQEKVEREGELDVEDSDQSSGSESDDGSSSRSTSRRGSKASRQDSSKQSSRRSLASKSKFGVDLSQMENKNRKKDDNSKKVLAEKIAERQAERQKEEKKRLKDESKMKPKQKSTTKASAMNRRGSITKLETASNQQKHTSAGAQDDESIIKLQKVSQDKKIKEGDSPQQSEGGPGISSTNSLAAEQKLAKKDKSLPRKARAASNHGSGTARDERGERKAKGSQRKADDEAGQKKKQRKEKRNRQDSSKMPLVVSVKGIDEAEDERQAEGFKSDGNLTEPLDRTKEILEELEVKVLQKYVIEIQEADEEPVSTFKLKAGQNKDLLSAFIDSLGNKLKSKDDTALMMTGNLPDMIDKINGLQGEYLRAHEQPPQKKSKKSEAKVYKFDDTIQLADCISTEISVDGELKGFSIRPELAKVIMCKQQNEEKGDMGKINKIVRSINYLNRIVFQPDDYILGTKKGGFKSFERPQSTSAKDDDAQATQEDNLSQVMRAATPSDGTIAQSDVFAQIVDILKKHVATICSKGNDKLFKYEMNVQREKSFEQLMLHVIPNISDQQVGKNDVNDEVSSMRSTASLTFLQYLQILLKNFEMKMQSVIPQDTDQVLSVQELVFLSNASGGDGESQTFFLQPARPSMQDQTCQTDQSSQNPVLNQQSKQVFAKTPQGQISSPFPSISLTAIKKAGTTTADKSTETDDSLFVDYIKGKEAKDTKKQVQIVNTHIEQAVGEEMTKTIATLGEFVEKVQLQSELILQAERGINQSTLSNMDGRQRSPLLGTSLSGHQHSRTSQAMIDQANPLQQLMQIRNKVQYGSEMIQVQMNEQMQARDKQQAQRREEFEQRRKEQAAKAKKLNMNQLTLTQKFPRLGNNSNPQNVQSERSYSISATAEVSKMPLLHNSTTKASTLVQKPFKQVHMDKKTINQDSTTQSKFSYQNRQARHRSQRPGSVGRNPPGLVAKRLDYPSPTPDMIKDGNFIVNGSLESKDFGRYDANNNTATSNKMSNVNTRATASVPRAAQNSSQIRDFNNSNSIMQNSRLNSRLNDGPLILNSRSGFVQTEYAVSPLQNLTLMNSQLTKNKPQQVYGYNHQQNQHMRLSNQQDHFTSQSRNGGYPASFLSTPQSMSMQMNKPFTRESSKEGVTERINCDQMTMHTPTRQRVLVEPPLSIPAAAHVGLATGHRKTSTTMMMMPKTNQELAGSGAEL